MADPSTCSPLKPASVRKAYEIISKHVHQTPLITCKSLDTIASHPQPASFLSLDTTGFSAQSNSSTSTSNQSSSSGTKATAPKFRLYFKCENQQKIGAFKARGAFHAITHLIESVGLEDLQKRGVTTHSSGNHAQALALASHTFGIPSHIVMPTISTPSKIAGTRMYTDNVIFSGSTSTEREAKVQEVIANTGAILVPPYDHPDIILGQGTAAYEMESQFKNIKKQDSARFDAVITPLGGGGLLSGTATWFSHTADDTSGKRTLVFGAEPSFSGANDGQMGLAQTPPKRIEHVKSLTIADGLRTPVGLIPWSIISDKQKLKGIYSASEDEIKMALRFMMERVKVFVEPSAVVPVAVILFCKEFRGLVADLQAEEATRARSEVRPWDVGVILSGGNTTVEAIAQMFGTNSGLDQNGASTSGEREAGMIGTDGSRQAEDIAG